ncbi:lipoprotein [Aequorivita echinoideorum]|uniref:Type IV secretion system putative lipoprotein virB7 n=1 Tax=Aequorivita echinoideorum TaxID=1549647 RepID=A0ABS5S277_9FLAO|nr:hypothetical protein [Aequorivita echinoideorum]MBT0607307.1 hypothetical protein [Aequorivita echinoideorum]
MKKLIYILFAMLVIAGCNNGKKEELRNENESSKMNEVVAVHDELMPKMSTVGELQGKLRAQIDSINPDSTKVAVLGELKAANENMMEWMKSFGRDFTFEEINKDEKLSPEKEQLLSKYEKSVSELKEQMNAAIRNAETIIEKSENN